VRVTGVQLLDPIAAIGVGLLLARAGVGILRHAADALMDREDPAALEQVIAAFKSGTVPGLVSLHRLRAQRFGGVLHVDAHVTAARYWTVEESHAAVEVLEARLRAAGLRGELALHLDPCTPPDCPTCDLDRCPVRAAPFVARRLIDVDVAGEPLGRGTSDPSS